jgi:hypothetical protein
VAFTSVTEPRKDTIETIGIEVIEINEDTFNGISRPSPVVVIIKVGIPDTIDTAFIAVST